MKLQVFTVFDQKAEAYLQPFFSGAVGTAVRSFSDVVNEKGHQFNLHPADFVLFHLGSYDDATARFELLPAPRALGVAVEYLQSAQGLPLFPENSSKE